MLVKIQKTRKPGSDKGFPTRPGVLLVSEGWIPHETEVLLNILHAHLAQMSGMPRLRTLPKFF